MSKTPNKVTQAELLERIEFLTKQVETLVDAAKKQGTQGVSPVMPLWAVIRDYLRRHGGSSEANKMVGDLLASGHNMGKYPFRNLKITLGGPHVKSLFRSELVDGKEIINLVEADTFYAPRSSREAARSKPPKSAKG